MLAPMKRTTFRLRKEIIVYEYERGLLYHHGRFVELLPPGRYRLWNWEDRQIDRVDIREFSQTVDGQEIPTGDKIGVRVTLIAQFRVADPIAARHSVGDYQSQLYQDLQLTLREAASGISPSSLAAEGPSVATTTARGVSFSLSPNVSVLLSKESTCAPRRIVPRSPMQVMRHRQERELWESGSFWGRSRSAIRSNTSTTICWPVNRRRRPTPERELPG